MNTLVAAVCGALCTTLLLTSITARPRPRRPARRGGKLDTRRFAAVRWRPRSHRLPAVSPTALAIWADDLARSLRHGMTLRAALGTVQPTDHALARHVEPLQHLLDRGANVRDACSEWMTGDDATPNRPHLLGTLAAVLTAAATIGGSAAAPLDRFAVAMRQRASEDLERRAHSAQASMSARVLTVVPIAVLLLLLLTDDDVRAVVVRPSGALVVLVGVLLNGLGAWWMRTIIGRQAMGSRP